MALFKTKGGCRTKKNISKKKRKKRKKKARHKTYSNS